MTDEQQGDVEYVPCYVAFADILGFKALVRRSQGCQKTRSALVRALDVVATLSPSEFAKRDVTYEKDRVTASPTRLWKTQIRFFSDSVAMFIPAETHGLSEILWKVRYLHDRLLSLGCCMRGAVTIGDMYWNHSWSRSTGNTGTDMTQLATRESVRVLYDRDAPPSAPVLLGQGLIDAYKLESEVAVYPRILISPELVKYIKRMSTAQPENSSQGIHKAAYAVFLCSPCPENASRCTLDFIRTDSDGEYFLDVFHRDNDRRDVKQIVERDLPGGRVCTEWIRDEMTHERFMRDARSNIEGFLRESSTEEVRKKHLWLADYFNSSISHLDISPLPVEWGAAQ